MEDGEDFGGVSDRSYNKLVSQEEPTPEEQEFFANQGKQKVSMSLMRPESSCNHYQRLTFLAVFAIILLAVDIGLGVHYNKLTSGQRFLTDMNNELDKLQTSYNAATQRKTEANKLLAKETSEQQLAKWELEHQSRKIKDYAKLTDEIRLQTAGLKAHMPMIKEGCRHCLPGWTFMCSRCYFFALSDDLLNRPWHAARQFCMKHGGDLAAVDTREKHLAMIELVNIYHDSSRSFYQSGFWIGLRDVEQEGTWKWLDGKRLAGSYWNDGEPNNQGNEDCAAMYPRSNPFKSWNDASCTHALKWVCEMTPNTAS
ncbi:CD209 antigen-like protein E [Brachionichthys hirsutus]|uniref:CD209 antigen-like protein E n=1 Tax=Brachionichthys hirsutus TaxID=412623 RepID=UPI0036046E5A